MCKMESDLESRPHSGDIRNQPSGKKTKRKCGSQHIESLEVIINQEAGEITPDVRKLGESSNSVGDCEDYIRFEEHTIAEVRFTYLTIYTQV